MDYAIDANTGFGLSQHLHLALQNDFGKRWLLHQPQQLQPFL
jgi:hypothetical protein